MENRRLLRRTGTAQHRFHIVFRLVVIVISAAVLNPPVSAAASLFPGIGPVDYPSGAELDVFAANLVSSFVRLPYDYLSLPFCTPDPKHAERVRSARTDRLALGQILLGERGRLTAYHFSMLENKTCVHLCTANFSEGKASLLATRIIQGYRARLTLDEMPVSTISSTGRRIAFGYPLGTFRINTHADTSHQLDSRNDETRSMFLGKKILSDRGQLKTAEEVGLQARSQLSKRVLREIQADQTNLLGGKELKMVEQRSKLLHHPRRARNALRSGGLSVSVEVHNHLDFIVRYHIPDDFESVTGSSGLLSAGGVARIVGFEVHPTSVDYPLSNPPSGVDPTNHCVSDPRSSVSNQKPLTLTRVRDRKNSWESRQIKFTYSVHFIKSDVKWSTRFDSFFAVSEGRYKIQLFSILNSLMLALFLSGVFALVLLRTLRRDCARYGITNARTSELLSDDFRDDFENDSGWRMLRGDVFRPPWRAGLLSILCGSGIQIAGIIFCSFFCSLIGIFRPGNRGNLVTALIFLWALSSSVAGFVSASFYKALGGFRLKLVIFGVAFALPGVAFSTFLVVNLFMWAVGSIGAVPFTTLVVLFGIWFGVSVPLAFVGSYFGFSRKAYEFPVRTNQIPRQIPPQPRYIVSPYAELVAGVLPFIVVAVELQLVVNSIWQREYNYMFAFLFAVYVVLAITCAEVSVVLCYLRLASENWNWWWSSFWSAGSSGLYVFLYSVYVLFTSPGADPKLFVSNTLFLAYSALVSLWFALLTGSIGCLCSLAFIRRIYSISSDD